VDCRPLDGLAAAHQNRNPPQSIWWEKAKGKVGPAYSKQPCCD